MRAAIVFDLFHTLVDTEHLRPPGFTAVKSVADVIGAEPTDFAEFWDSTYVERETSLLDLVDLTARYCDHVGLAFTAVQREHVDALFGVCKDDALRTPRDDVVALLGSVASRSRVGVLSNCHVREVRAWTESPLAAHVDVFGRSYEMGCMKPDARSYEWVLERLGVDPADATFVGNGASDELLGARAVGFATVVHCNVYDAVNGLVAPDEQQRRAGQADVSVRTVEELAAAITA